MPDDGHALVSWSPCHGVSTCPMFTHIQTHILYACLNSTNAHIFMFFLLLHIIMNNNFCNISWIGDWLIRTRARPRLAETYSLTRCAKTHSTKWTIIISVCDLRSTCISCHTHKQYNTNMIVSLVPHDYITEIWLCDRFELYTWKLLSLSLVPKMDWCRRYIFYGVVGQSHRLSPWLPLSAVTVTSHSDIWYSCLCNCVV